jgi:hypothetical protein
MSATKYYSLNQFAKGRYRELADQLSQQAFYAFDLLLGHSESAPFTFEQIEEISLKAKRFHTGVLLEKCLLELEQAKCLIVEERSRAACD